ncbi:MAG TPA: hypothetical protein VMV69_13415 [Pirellulales bacterium]|nr:hypothetical protein [Pirellulales bacterium]
MNERAISIQNALAARCSAGALGLWLLTCGGCYQSHSPAVTSPAHASSAANEVDGAPTDRGAANSTRPPSAQRTPTVPAAPAAMSDITFDALKFDIKTGDPFERSMIPKLTEELHGKPIRIRGYILPESAYSLTDLPGFILTRDSDTCCFGPNRALCDFIVVHMNPGKSANFSSTPIAVEGVFSIEELVDPADPDGAVGAIYRLDAELAR